MNTQKHLQPYRAAARGFVDEVIDPKDTRCIKLIKGFRMLGNKVVKMPKRKHGNIPVFYQIVFRGVAILHYHCG